MEDQPDEEEQQQQQPPQQEEAEEEEEDQEAPPPKRRRGRPRKEEQLQRDSSPSIVFAQSANSDGEDEEFREGTLAGKRASRAARRTAQREEEMEIPGAAVAAPRIGRFERMMRESWAGATDDGLERAVAYYKRARPSLAFPRRQLIDSMIGPSQPAMRTGWTQALEDEIQAQWDASDEKRSLEAASWVERVTALWKASLQLLRCSPVAIVSPAYNLWVQASNPGEVFWTVAFSEALTLLVANPVWRGNKALLRRAIQLAVICRTDNRASWTMEQPEMCGVIAAMARLFSVGSRPHAPKYWIEKAFEELPEGKVACPEACFLRHLAGICTPKRPQSAASSQFVVQKKDLVKIAEAIETFGEGFYPSTGSVSAIYYAYLATRSGLTAPIGEAETKAFHEQAWKHEMRRAKRRQLGLRFDDAAMAHARDGPILVADDPLPEANDPLPVADDSMPVADLDTGVVITDEPMPDLPVREPKPAHDMEEDLYGASPLVSKGQDSSGAPLVFPDIPPLDLGHRDARSWLPSGLMTMQEIDQELGGDDGYLGGGASNGSSPDRELGEEQAGAEQQPSPEMEVAETPGLDTWETVDGDNHTSLLEAKHDGESTADTPGDTDPDSGDKPVLDESRAPSVLLGQMSPTPAAAAAAAAADDDKDCGMLQRGDEFVVASEEDAAAAGNGAGDGDDDAKDCDMLQRDDEFVVAAEKDAAAAAAAATPMGLVGYSAGPRGTETTAPPTGPSTQPGAACAVVTESSSSVSAEPQQASARMDIPRRPLTFGAREAIATANPPGASSGSSHSQSSSAAVRGALPHPGPPPPRPPPSEHMQGQSGELSLPVVVTAASEDHGDGDGVWVNALDHWRHNRPAHGTEAYRSLPTEDLEHELLAELLEMPPIGPLQFQQE
ncbi:hypothetical protein JDV02_009917 [Purpureocillium takamizusanense]|uniref:Uncharacterized protein n=1 Tax=Purpureocillium takamizusanense TaxID=2060973 RepID=A0A9Q8QMZ1_9HYPO|nr:uncharacterized protein JDV02_009917 [Purpureocillium takamizusanense]UNI24144.1 hypothetical protein JDV02_009917 [Purpureocillium takamizusanense]